MDVKKDSAKTSRQVKILRDEKGNLVGAETVEK
jgi:hypothetical protein